MTKNLYCIVGQSGAGKTAVTKELEKRGLKQIQSYTTRPPRAAGEEGHIFISNEEFDELQDIIAYVEYCGNRYCATREQANQCDLYVIDPDGVKKLRELYTDKPIKVIYIRSDVSTRYERLKKRYISNEEECDAEEFKEGLNQALERIVNDVGVFYQYEHSLTQIDLNVKNNADNSIVFVAESIYNYITSEEESDG